MEKMIEVREKSLKGTLELTWQFAYGDAYYKSTLEKIVKGLEYALTLSPDKMLEQIQDEITRINESLLHAKEAAPEYAKVKYLQLLNP